MKSAHLRFKSKYLAHVSKIAIVAISAYMSGHAIAKPIISDMAVSQVEDHQATIFWNLDQIGDGVVEYGQSTSFGQWSTKEDSFKWSYHIQTLTGLQAGTKYYFRAYSADRAGEIAISGTGSFTTSGTGSSTNISTASTPVASSSTPVVSNTPAATESTSSYNNNLPYGGLFYGNPTGGVHAANAFIAEVSSRRFRAEKTGSVSGVRYHNRVLSQSNIDLRCNLHGDALEKSTGQWCECKKANLDAVACGYTLGSSYQVGNGGLITIEVRPDDGNGFPSDRIIGKSAPFVPYSLNHNGYPKITLTDPAELVAGNLYHLVYTNARMPVKCDISHVSTSQANSCDRDRGAIGLNGVFYPHSSTTSGSKGPWFGTKSAANLYKRKASDEWALYPGNLSWYELSYTDGTNVGDTYTALSATLGEAQKLVQGNSRARQIFTVNDASRHVDGVWLNFGHTRSADGSSLSVALKNSSGQTLATGSIAASAQCVVLSKENGWNEHCRDWGYTSFNRSVELLEGSVYSVEFSAGSNAGFEVSTLEPLSKYHDFEDRNNWEDAFGQVSTNNGSSWHDWAARMPKDRDMSVLFTIQGMPRQMP